MSEQLHYQTDQDVARLDAELDKQWADLVKSGELARRATAAGVAPELLTTRSRAEFIRIDEGPEGLDPITIGIIVAISGAAAGEATKAAASIVKDAWHDLLLPRLRQRFGTEAVVKQVGKMDAGADESHDSPPGPSGP